mmetsp:Transcript_4334/g.13998  ORF Transcript_4334/g.13998 Transcript_4334/m.13998 type:complete len:280 (-) Transcript_4334:31-870(-)
MCTPQSPAPPSCLGSARRCRPQRSRPTPRCPAGQGRARVRRTPQRAAERAAGLSSRRQRRGRTGGPPALLRRAPLSAPPPPSPSQRWPRPTPPRWRRCGGLDLAPGRSRRGGSVARAARRRRRTRRTARATPVSLAASLQTTLQSDRRRRCLPSPRRRLLARWPAAPRGGKSARRRRGSPSRTPTRAESARREPSRALRGGRARRQRQPAARCARVASRRTVASPPLKGRAAAGPLWPPSAAPCQCCWPRSRAPSAGRRALTLIAGTFGGERPTGSSPF